ncbi:CGNR zinc finger domain-containing protein [Amycolatopsis sacchari]|uniref:CGNR zinc finger domain-containing protein n=1 Tax=Amycolatopsis sacchari TaxID=115433 RepID=UPI003EC0393A
MEMRPLVGGHVVLDFVNTVAWRLDPARFVDDLTTADALVTWLRRTGLLRTDPAPVAPARAAAAVERARKLRDDLYAVLSASIDGQEPPADAAEAVHRAIVEALGRARLTGVVPLRWEFTPADVSELPVSLALEVWRFLESVDRTRLRQCADEGCGWVFLDGSRNGSRRWCSSADCGNRSRARRHYERNRARR